MSGAVCGRPGKQMKKKIYYKGRLIEYELEKKRVKNINLRLDREGNISVSAPRYVSAGAVEAFILSRAERILGRQDELRRSRAALADSRESVTIAGECLRPVIVPGKRDRAYLENGRLLITLREPESGEGFEKAVDGLLRALCEKRVKASVERVFPIFEAMGVKMPELSFRRMKRTWGNCRPAEGRLCFNTALARVPEECLEYVVYHELCHFIRPDHSPRFHALMTRLLPGWKERKKTLEKYAALM